MYLCNNVRVYQSKITIIKESKEYTQCSVTLVDITCFSIICVNLNLYIIWKAKHLQQIKKIAIKYINFLMGFCVLIF